MDQTFELVRERGFAGLRIRLIAERVGVTEGALYRHFPSKDAILLALVDRIEGKLLEPIRKIASRPDPSPRDKLEQILRHHLRTLIETRSLPLLLISEASFSDHDELRERTRQLMSSYLGTLETLAGELEDRGMLTPKEVALLLLGLPAAVALSHRLLPDEKLAARLVGTVAHEYIRLLLPG